MDSDLPCSSKVKASASQESNVDGVAFADVQVEDSNGDAGELELPIPELPPGMLIEDYRRTMASFRFFNLITAVDRDAELARQDGREADYLRLRAEKKSLERQRKAVLDYSGFTAAAEALHKAKDFDAFIAAIPGVDLARTYGGTSSTISPFPLVWAMEARDRPLERVQALLNAGARLDLTTRYPNFSLLHWIAKSKRKAHDKRLSILRLLVLRGADLEARDGLGRTPLHVAIEMGSVDDMAVLLDAGADAGALCGDYGIQPTAGLGRTCLMMAAEAPEKLKLLLKYGADPAQKAANGTGLTQHLRQQLSQAEIWLKEMPEKQRAGSSTEKLRNARAEALALFEPVRQVTVATLGRKLTFREAPELFYALQTDLPLEEWRTILARLDINSYHAANGDCPIFWPIRAKSDRPQRLWLMLQAGASVEGHPEVGSAVHIFARTPRKNIDEQMQILRILLQAGAQLDTRDTRGRTPFAGAIERGGYAEAVALLRILSERRGPEDPEPRFGRMLRAAEGQPRMFKLLLDNGAYPLPGSSTRRGVDRRLAEEIERLESKLATALSDNQRREAERQLRAFRSCQAMLVERDASAD